MLIKSAILRRLAWISVCTAFSSSAAAEWLILRDNDEYAAYVDPDTIFRAGDTVQMKDMIDLKAPRSSPYGKRHASSRAHSEFDCQNARMRTIAFSLYSGQMGDGDVIETVADAGRWLPVAPGTLLDVLWQFACDRT